MKTYSHTLDLHEEKLVDQASKMSELEKRVVAKRRELLRSRKAKFQEASANDPKAKRELEVMEVAYREYLEEENETLPPTEEELKRADVAPLPPEEINVTLRFETQEASR